MCGTPVSGPILILLFPLMIGGAGYTFIRDSFSSMDHKIRENNQKIDSNWKSKRRELKEKILYRKQDQAEKMLNQKIKINDQDQQSFNEKDSLNELVTTTDHKIVSSDDAILYLQRCLVRCASNKYDKALKDLRFSVYLDYTLKDTYIVQYLEGFLLYVMGDYLESAHAFKKAIELKELSDKKSIELETKVFEIQNTMKHTSEKVLENLNEFHEQTRLYFKQAKNLFKTKLIGKQIKEEEQVETKQDITSSNATTNSMISLEELYYRAGISYYFSTYYRDSIECYNKSIEIGKDNSNLHFYIYNRGLSYFYCHEIDLALNDFLTSFNLHQSDECAKMIAYSYGRKDMKREYNIYIEKAKSISSNTKIISAFSYRLLDDNCTELIFSFLPIHNRMLISRTCKYWSEISMKSLVNQDEVFEISFKNLINDVGKQLTNYNNTSSLKEKLFMPSHEKSNALQVLNQTLNSSFFKYYWEKTEKKVTCFMVQYPEYDSQFFYIENGDLEKLLLTNVVYFNAAQSYLKGKVIRNLVKRSPNLKELIIRTNTYLENDMDIVKSIKKFNKLKKLAWHVDFTTLEFENEIYPKLDFPPSLQIFEYDSKCTSLFEKYFIPKYPKVKFIPIDNTLEISQNCVEIVNYYY